MASTSSREAAAEGDVTGFTSSCQFPKVQPLGFSTTACSTAVAGSVVLLNFTVSEPAACFGVGVIAATPRVELLQNCPCRRSPRGAAPQLPRPHAGAAVAVDGSYTCSANGVYSYGWQTPSTAGCYRITVIMTDGSSVMTILKLMDSTAMATQAVTA
jgi:hypothetical protein